MAALSRTLLFDRIGVRGLDARAHRQFPDRGSRVRTRPSLYRTNLSAERLQGAPKYGNDNDWNWDDPGRARVVNDYYSGF
jgi:hypothetical protein